MELNFAKKQELRKQIVDALYNREPTVRRYLPKDTLMKLINISESEPKSTDDYTKLKKSRAIAHCFFEVLIEHIDLSEIKWNELNDLSKKYLKEALEQCTIKRNENKAENIERIKLPKELLDDMLFFKPFTLSECQKIPYFGKIKMCEIDLSELDFSKVVWDVVHYFISIGTLRSDGYYEISNIPLIFKESSEYPIDMSYTNAQIDFDDCLNIRNVNFEGTNLSNNSMAYKDRRVIKCNFRKTGIKLPTTGYGKYISCDFRENDFSQAKYWINPIVLDQVSFNCKFQGTGLHIEFTNTETKEVLNNLGSYIKKGLLIDCFVNNKLVKDKKAKKEQKAIFIEQYKEYAKTHEDLVFELINNPRIRKKEGE